MNYLITGGLGFIGLNLASRLKKNGDNIILVDTKKVKKKIKNYKYYNIDITKNFRTLKKCIKQNNINIIIHFAAFLGVKKTEINPEKVITVNYIGTKNVLKACEGTKVKKFLFASSSEVYGDQNIYLSEKNECKPKSFYGFAKLKAEELIREYSKKNFKYQIVRFFNVYGPKQNKNFVIKKFFNLAKKNKEIQIYGSGAQIRCFCYIEDAISGIINVLRYGKKNFLYNIGNNKEPISINKLAKLIIKISKSKSRIIKIPFSNSDREKSREIFTRIPSIKKISVHTDFKPKFDLIKGLETFL